MQSGRGRHHHATNSAPGSGLRQEQATDSPSTGLDRVPHRNSDDCTAVGLAQRNDLGIFTNQGSVGQTPPGGAARIRSTPTEIQSTSENGFECLASTGGCYSPVWADIVGVVYFRNIPQTGRCRLRGDVSLRASQHLIADHELADRG